MSGLTDAALGEGSAMTEGVASEGREQGEVVNFYCHRAAVFVHKGIDEEHTALGIIYSSTTPRKRPTEQELVNN
jgi:hypothetical protein